MEYLITKTKLVSGVVFAALLTLALTAPARADEALWTLLKSGGRVVLMRHATTTPGTGDPPGFRLDDCSTQRNLTDDGRRDARRIGAEFRQRAIAIEQVLSSPWCRCMETTNLAFSKAGSEPALSNLFTHPQNRERQMRQMPALIAAPKAANRVLVSHGATIAALTGVSLGMAEMLVVTPQGNGRFVINGRLKVTEP